MQRTYPSTPRAVADAVRDVEARAGAAGLPDELLDRLALAAGEAIANAVEHGSASDPAGSFTVSLEVEDGGCWLRVQDQGPGLQAERIAQAELPADPLSTSGRGLYLIRTLADEVRLEAEGRRIALHFLPREEA